MNGIFLVIIVVALNIGEKKYDQVMKKVASMNLEPVKAFSNEKGDQATVFRVKEKIN